MNDMSGSQFVVHNDLPTVGVDASREIGTHVPCVANMGDKAYEIIDTSGFGSIAMANASFRRSDPSFLDYKNPSKSFKDVLFGSDTLNDFPDLKFLGEFLVTLLD
ncbi:hypothetical protein M5K25_002325 [Dendrobium thyrsiflorum]|uniref:Uncharacterized protein n=1 Tax=Dendrobium thyrsiflorum TaxID=117978 RepID=A0ABD0W422_DENTH